MIQSAIKWKATIFDKRHHEEHQRIKFGEMRPMRTASISCFKGLFKLCQAPKNTALYKNVFKSMLRYRDDCQTLVVWYRIDLPLIGVSFVIKHGNFLHLIKRIILFIFCKNSWLQKGIFKIICTFTRMHNIILQQSTSDRYISC